MVRPWRKTWWGLAFPGPSQGTLSSVFRAAIFTRQEAAIGWGSWESLPHSKAPGHLPFIGYQLALGSGWQHTHTSSAWYTTDKSTDMSGIQVCPCHRRNGPGGLAGKRKKLSDEDRNSCLAGSLPWLTFQHCLFGGTFVIMQWRNNALGSKLTQFYPTWVPRMQYIPPGFDARVPMWEMHLEHNNWLFSICSWSPFDSSLLSKHSLTC